jgi:regulator of protease activity HflC (stomatin/prohibitin superfamily)
MGVLELLLMIAGAVIGAAILVTLVKNSLLIVEQGTVAVIKRAGKHHKNKRAGLRCKLPFLDKVHRVFSDQRRTVDLRLVGDAAENLSVGMSVALELRGITAPDSRVVELAYAISEPLRYLETTASAAIRQILLPMPYERVVAESANGELGGRLMEGLQSVAAECGYVILSVRITSVRPEESVYQQSVSGERDKIKRADEAAAAKHSNELRLAAATTTAAAAAIEAEAERGQLRAQAEAMAEVVALFSSKGHKDTDAAAMAVALLHQQGLMSLGGNAKATINLLPANLTMTDLTGLTHAQPIAQDERPV